MGGTYSLAPQNPHTLPVVNAALGPRLPTRVGHFIAVGVISVWDDSVFVPANSRFDPRSARCAQIRMASEG
jgi:hypothetical protein